jgi:hypothetical protein
MDGDEYGNSDRNIFSNGDAYLYQYQHVDVYFDAHAF